MAYGAAELMTQTASSTMRKAEQSILSLVRGTTKIRGGIRLKFSRSFRVRSVRPCVLFFEFEFIEVGMNIKNGSKRPWVVIV